MEMDKVVDMMSRFGVAYISLPATNPRHRESFIVATTELDCPYIRSKNLKPRKVKDTQILVFSYSHDNLRVLEVEDIKRVRALNSELKRVRRL